MLNYFFHLSLLNEMKYYNFKISNILEFFSFRARLFDKKVMLSGNIDGSWISHTHTLTNSNK